MTISKNILVIEDTTAQALLIEEAFKDLGLNHNLQYVSDGAEAFTHLEADNHRPHLILLNIDVPTISGLDVLKVLKSSGNYRNIPVIMFSEPANEEDIATSYSLSVNCCIAKPKDYSELLSTIRHINQFWISTAMLPSA